MKYRIRKCIVTKVASGKHAYFMQTLLERLKKKTIKIIHVETKKIDRTQVGITKIALSNVYVFNKALIRYCHGDNLQLSY